MSYELSDELADVMIFPDFEDAFIGLSDQVNRPLLAVYDYTKMIDVLIQRDGMTYEEADEYLMFNTVGAWLGERTPIIVFPRDHYGI